MSYWQNYRKFFVSFQKAMWGDGGDGGERLGLRLAAEARRAGLRHAAGVRADAPGQDERLLLPGLQPAAVVPEPGEDHGGAVEAEVPGHHGSAADGDGAVLGEPRRATTTSIPRRSRPRCSSCRRPASPRTRARSPTPAAGCSGTGPGATPPGEAKHDIWIMAQLYLRLKALYQKEGGAFPDPILNLHWPYKDPDEPDAGRARQGDQRLGARRRARPDRSDQGRCCEQGKQLAELRAAARRRHDRVRLLDLLRLLQRGRQQHGPARQRRSRRHRRVSRTGRSPGRPTGASSTTAPRATCRASRGIRSAS